MNILLIIVTDSVSKACNAADFSAIDELAEDEEANYTRGLKYLSRDIKGTLTILRCTFIYLIGINVLEYNWCSLIA